MSSLPRLPDQHGVGDLPSEGRDFRFRLVALPPDTPRIASVAGYVGGLLILIEGLVELVGGLYVTVLGFVAFGSWITLTGGVGVVLGALILYLSFRLTLTSPNHRVFGVLLLALGLVSFVAGGGFAIGLLLCVAGGVWAIGWRPSPPFYVAPVGVWMCLTCGVAYDASSPKCPVCGSEYEVPGSTTHSPGARDFL